MPKKKKKKPSFNITYSPRKFFVATEGFKIVSLAYGSEKRAVEKAKKLSKKTGRRYRVLKETVSEVKIKKPRKPIGLKKMWG